MKTALALSALTLLALVACDDGPRPRPPADAATADDATPPDTGLDAALDADRDPPDGEPADGDPGDATIEPGDFEPPDSAGDLDPPDEGPACPETTTTLDGADLLGADGAWRLALDAPVPAYHHADCGDTRGDELTVLFTPAVDGRHLALAEGEFTALYAAPPCDPTARVGLCAVAADTTHLLTVDLRAGEPVAFVVDAPRATTPGPVRFVLYPPREAGESCALLPDAPASPPCAPGLVCELGLCTLATPPAIETVRAFTDGQTLRVAVTADDAGGDLLDLLWARVGPDERFRQLEIIDVRRDADEIDLAGFIEAPELALADEVEIELLDATQRSTRMRVAVEPVDKRCVGEPCDPRGVEDACDPGAACVLALCQPVEFEGWIAPDGAHLRGRVADVPADTPDVSLRYRLLDDAGAPIGAWARLAPIAVPEAEFDLVYGEIVPAAEPAVAAAARVVPAARPPSLPVAIDLLRLPVRPDGAACDPSGLSDVCAAGTACIGGGAGAHCQRPEPPVVEGLRATRGDRAIGLKITWRDPNDDVTRYRLQVVDGAGVVRWSNPVALLPPHDGPSAQFSLLAPEMPGDRDHARVFVIDATGLTSAPFEVPFVAATPLREGDRCDPLGGLDRCPQGTLCAPLAPGASPVCQRPEVECPDAYGATTWELGALPFIWDDTDRNGPDREAGVCGGAGMPDLVYRVVAPRDDHWLIEVDTADTWIYVRRYCALPVPFESEIACGARRVDLDVEAGEVYFVFVDGPGALGGRFRVELDHVDADAIPLPEP